MAVVMAAFVTAVAFVPYSHGELAFSLWLAPVFGAGIGVAATVALLGIVLPYNYPAYIHVGPEGIRCHPSGRLASTYSFLVPYEGVVSMRTYERTDGVALRLGSVYGHVNVVTLAWNQAAAVIEEHHFAEGVVLPCVLDQIALHSASRRLP
jgi:hypothetical protein